MASMQKYAHSVNEWGKPHTLHEHLEGTAQYCRIFAHKFQAKESAFWAALLHDLGKFRIEFQEYLQGKRKKGPATNHAVYGAYAACIKQWNNLGIAWSIMGHHSGLKNKNAMQEVKIKAPESNVEILLEEWQELLKIKLPAQPIIPSFTTTVFSMEFFIRMLFSCLVDADYLDTEKHFIGQEREVVKLQEIIDPCISKLHFVVENKPTDGTLNQVRHDIFNQCVEKAESKQGFFSLTVPTGGGKTLSSMAFALHHARKHQMERIIVVIPYLSIIEQNATIYKDIFDADLKGILVESHSGVSFDENEENSPYKLAIENWDAPMIITTSVQFIESLFANRPSKCRKLHNIARSVVLFDEVQTLPVHLMAPIMSVFEELKTNYGVSFIFSTATQPIFRELSKVQEIIKEPEKIFQTLKRVDYKKLSEPVDWEKLGRKIADSSQCLCIVNTRSHARELWENVRDSVSEEQKEFVYHLSSSMCPQHRIDTLNSIRDLLKQRKTCRIISTQVIEAGVDIDFPVVYRAMGPLEAIVQSAGRCNRENKLLDNRGNAITGKTYIFDPEDKKLPKGIYKTATNLASAALINSHGQIDSLDNPSAFHSYFQTLYSLSSQDKHYIQEDRQNLYFEDVAQKAVVIEDNTNPIVIFYGEAEEIIKDIRTRVSIADEKRFTRSDQRKLQRYMVSLYQNQFDFLKHYGSIEELLPNLGLYVLKKECYHQHLGLIIDERPKGDYII